MKILIFRALGSMIQHAAWIVMVWHDIRTSPNAEVHDIYLRYRCMGVIVLALAALSLFIMADIFLFALYVILYIYVGARCNRTLKEKNWPLFAEDKHQMHWPH